MTTSLSKYAVINGDKVEVLRTGWLPGTALVRRLDDLHEFVVDFKDIQEGACSDASPIRK